MEEAAKKYNRKDKEWPTANWCQLHFIQLMCFCGQLMMRLRVVLLSLEKTFWPFGKAKQRGLSWPGAFGFAHLFLGVKVASCEVKGTYGIPTKSHPRFIFSRLFFFRDAGKSVNIIVGGSKSGCQTNSHFLYRFFGHFQHRWLYLDRNRKDEKLKAFYSLTGPTGPPVSKMRCKETPRNSEKLQEKKRHAIFSNFHSSLNPESRLAGCSLAGAAFRRPARKLVQAWGMACQMSNWSQYDLLEDMITRKIQLTTTYKIIVTTRLNLLWLVMLTSFLCGHVFLGNAYVYV